MVWQFVVCSTVYMAWQAFPFFYLTFLRGCVYYLIIQTQTPHAWRVWRRWYCLREDRRLLFWADSHIYSSTSKQVGSLGTFGSQCKKRHLHADMRAIPKHQLFFSSLADFFLIQCIYGLHPAASTFELHFFIIVIYACLGASYTCSLFRKGEKTMLLLKNLFQIIYRF